MPIEREITDQVDLCDKRGHVNRAAVGWSRQPVHRAEIVRWGRRKRWEYWAVQSPDCVFALTVSDLDYAHLHAVYFLDPNNVEVTTTALTAGRPLALPVRAGDAAVNVITKHLDIRITPSTDGVRLWARTDHLEADLRITRPPGHESLGVVVPWSDSRFQYTVKENSLPAVGQVWTQDATFDFAADCWATWDFGRGKWPYRVTWNWGSGSGEVDGQVLGLQFGGKWTDGTGSTENAVTVAGRLHKISQDLVWEYNPDDWGKPWHVHSADGAVDMEFRPTHVRSDVTHLGLIDNVTHQCFGTWHGSVAWADGQIVVDGMRGWAEEVRNRW